MEKIAIFNLFILLPIWGDYTGENMALWAAVAILLLLPGFICLRRVMKEQGQKNENQ